MSFFLLGYTLSILLGSIITSPYRLVFSERRLLIPYASVDYCCYSASMIENVKLKTGLFKELAPRAQIG